MWDKNCSDWDGGIRVAGVQLHPLTTFTSLDRSFELVTASEAGIRSWLWFDLTFYRILRQISSTTTFFARVFGNDIATSKLFLLRIFWPSLSLHLFLFVVFLCVINPISARCKQLLGSVNKSRTLVVTLNEDTVFSSYCSTEILFMKGVIV